MNETTDLNDSTESLFTLLNCSGGTINEILHDNIMHIYKDFGPSPKIHIHHSRLGKDK